MNDPHLIQSQIQVGEVTKPIYGLRGQPVMLDSDLAAIYEIETKVLKQAVRRNMKRFPANFMFELTLDEQKNLRSQFVTLRSQASLEHYRFAPYVFTELGVSMLSSVLNSERAILINISIMEAFVHLRNGNGTVIQESQRFEHLENRILELESLVKKRPEMESSSLRQVNAIQLAVALHFGITIEDLKSDRRFPIFTQARHIAIYLVRRHLGLSLNEIGRHFGGRDHATILHALEKIEHLTRANNAIDAIWSSIQ